MGTRRQDIMTTRTIRTCDLCDRDLGGSEPHRCDICGREAGYCCSMLRLAYDSRNPGRIDLVVRVCADCERAGGEEPTPPMDVIQAAVKAADRQIGVALEVWRKASAEWRAKKKEG